MASTFATRIFARLQKLKIEFRLLLRSGMWACVPRVETRGEDDLKGNVKTATKVVLNNMLFCCTRNIRVQHEIVNVQHKAHLLIILCCKVQAFMTREKNLFPREKISRSTIFNSFYTSMVQYMDNVLYAEEEVAFLFLYTIYVKIELKNFN
jgi:hypothetical protein